MFRAGKYIVSFILLAASLWVVAPWVVGEEEAGGEGDKAQPQAVQASSPIYVPLKPTFVVNYGGKGPLKYLKADLTVRLTNPATVNAVLHHLPYIRNNLVMLLSSQTEASLGSQAGKEALRKEALAQVRAVLKQQTGSAKGVVDIYFDNLIIQK